MTGLWLVLGGIVFGVAWFWIENIIDERLFLRNFRRSRPQPPTPEEIFIGMRERKHDTMRQMRDVARDYRRP